MLTIPNLMMLLCLLVWVGIGIEVAIAADRLHVLKLGSALTPASQPLYSSSSKFILSFRTPPTTSASTSSYLFLAISYLVNSTAGYPVWVANRNTSVSASASLILSSSGDLLLSDHTVSSSASIWSSNTSGRGVVQAELLDSGNLVLLNRSSAHVWQSFHYPTDTLLPGQNFTASSSSLISNKKSGDFLSGRFSLQFTPGGVLQLLNTDTSIAHWDEGKITFLLFNEVGNITFYNSPSSINSTYITNDYGKSAMRRMTLDMDGNLRLYTWDATSIQWNIVWMAVLNICGVQGLCGSYGVCTYDPVQPTCVCPQGFSVVDSTDLSSGCKPNYTLEAGCSTSPKYVEIAYVDFPYNDYLNFTSSSIEECKKYCTNYCRCVAAVYWQSLGHCWLKQKVENGAVRWSQVHRVFLKISAADPLVSSPAAQDKALTWSFLHLWQPEISNQSITVYTSSRKHFGTVIALGVLLTIQTLGFAATIVALITRYRKNLRYARLGEELEGSLHVLSYEELKAASENFSHKIGGGGFGTVYKGQLQNGKLVAIKQLEGISQQEQQFRAEIMTLGRIHHINLMPLVGFCAEGNHRLLVYEYMEKGSLGGELFQRTDEPIKEVDVLDWSTRFQICLGVARGIYYLHAECLECILHCDIKPENVLLDKSYCPKVADFGLAYLYSRHHTLKVSTIRGTRGYLAPEWLSNLPITAKADVYSYGMLMMEVISGRHNYLYTESCMMESNEKWCFPIWAYGKRIEDVIDTRLNRSSTDLEQAELALKVAFACIQSDMNARPSMAKVVQMLEGMLPVPDTPPPSLFSQDRGHHVSSSSRHSAIASSSSSRTLSSTRNLSAKS